MKLVWPSKIVCSLILIQNMFIDWVLGTKSLKTLFWRSGLNSNIFWKTFKLIIMHFIYEIKLFEWFMHKTSFVFQKFQFSKFSIDQIYFSTDRKCVKNFGLNLPGSIGARSIEFIFWSIEPQFWPIEIRKFSLLKCFSLTCSSLFQKLFRLFLSFSLRPIQSKGFLSFSSTNFSKVFVLKHW